MQILLHVAPLQMEYVPYYMNSNERVRATWEALVTALTSGYGLSADGKGPNLYAVV